MGKRGGQMDGQPCGQVGSQEIGYRMVDGVGSMLCPPEIQMLLGQNKHQV